VLSCEKTIHPGESGEATLGILAEAREDSELETAVRKVTVSEFIRLIELCNANAGEYVNRIARKSR